MESKDNQQTSPVFDLKKYNIGAEEIRNESDILIQKCNDEKENIGLLKVKIANQWIEEAKIHPMPNILF